MFTALLIGLSLAVLGVVPQVDPERLRRFARIVREMLQKSDLSLEKASLHMGMSKQQLSSQLSGEGHLSFTRFLLLPDESLQWLGVLLVTHLGAPDVVLKMMALEHATHGRQQLSMTLSETREQQKESA